METLYKVLFAVCLLFLVAGIIYVVFYLPQVPAASAVEAAIGNLEQTGMHQ
ncbi:MAG: hypothetical protein H0Z34_12155 [Brevibacillus sp.]|nr:hypothetical protein [Brevibacillus sp.]